ncbi:MAG: hypothetical protein ABIV05_04365, partial [Actinomycetota bacterium]
GLLTGCGLSPAQTTIAYDPADGVSARVGDVQVRNLLVVGTTAEAPGVVSGVLLNGGTDAVTVTVASGASAPVPVDIPGSSSVQLGVAGTDPTSTPVPGTQGNAVVQLSAVGEPAGAVVPVTLTSAGGGTTTVQVPVVPATNEYATITPTAVPPSEGPTEASTPAESPSAPTAPVTPTPTAS